MGFEEFIKEAAKKKKRSPMYSVSRTLTHPATGAAVGGLQGLAPALAANSFLKGKARKGLLPLAILGGGIGAGAGAARVVLDRIIHGRALAGRRKAGTEWEYETPEG